MNQIISSDRKKKHHLFGLNFKEHIFDFMNSHMLISPHKKIMISVSGGVDSRVLVDILNSLGLNFELLHFNHGTRPHENAVEEKMVLELGLELDVKVNVYHFDISLLSSNFEKKARDLRKNIYNHFIENDYWVYTAHHIDDSFEWSLMQSFRQSGMNNLGIPLFNKGLIRPFMCVTKKQIYRYAKARELCWIEDTSNVNEKFERNFMRLNITKKILQRYPGSLAHYVSRHNQLAVKQNLHRLNSQSSSVVTKEKFGGFLMVAEDFKNHKNEIKDLIYKLSNKNRGEIDHELDKIIKAQDEIKKNPASFPFKGPMNFSGGVELYLIKDHLFLSNTNQMSFYQVLDYKLYSYLQTLPQIPECAIILHFPKLLINFRKKLTKSSKYVHPLLPLTCQWLKKHGISYTFTPLLTSKDRQMLANDAVILDSSVMGL